jgi:hypothetical protein
MAFLVCHDFNIISPYYHVAFKMYYLGTPKQFLLHNTVETLTCITESDGPI